MGSCQKTSKPFGLSLSNDPRQKTISSKAGVVAVMIDADFMAKLLLLLPMPMLAKANLACMVKKKSHPCPLDFFLTPDMTDL